MDQQTNPEATPGDTPVVPPVNGAPLTPESLATPSKNSAGPIIGIVIILILIAGGAYAYTQGLFPSLSGAPFSQDDVIEETVKALSKVERGRAELEVAVLSEPQDADVYPFPQQLREGDEFMEMGFSLWAMGAQMIPSDFSANLGIAGSFDLADESSTGGEAQVTFDLDLGDFVVNSDIEFMIDNLETLYVKVNRFPSLLLDLGAAKGRWIAITDEYLESLGVPPLSDLEEGMSDEEMAEMEEALEFAFSLFSEVEAHDILVASEPVREEVEGENLYRYQMAINGENAEAFYRAIADDYREFLLNQYEDDDFMREIMEDMINEMFGEEQIQLYSSQAYIDYYNVHAPWSIWVTADGEVRQVGVTTRMVFAEDDAPNFADKQIRAEMILRLEDVNESIEFNPPNDAVTLEELADEVPIIEEFLNDVEASIKFETQYKVDGISYDMDTHLAEVGQYPASLDELRTFIEAYEIELYGDSYAYDYDPNDEVMYTTVNQGAGYIACVAYPNADNYYCLTDSTYGDVPLTAIGDPTDSLAEMYDAIVAGIQSGEYMTPEERDDARSATLEAVAYDFDWLTWEYDDLSVAWEDYKINDDPYGSQWDTVPGYMEITFTEITDSWGDPDYELCTRLEAKEAYWCMSGYSYTGYEVKATSVE